MGKIYNLCSLAPRSPTHHYGEESRLIGGFNLKDNPKNY